ALTTLFALVVVGICAHIESLIAGYSDVFLTFAAFGLAAGAVTVVSLPLFLFLGRLRRGIFTSMIVFEIIWFFILWILWVATAGDTVAARTYYFPEGCVLDQYPQSNQICYEITAVEAFSFLAFFCVFIYYDVLVLYAIINAIRGKGIWTASVHEAAGVTGPPSAIPMNQTQYASVPGGQYQNYGGFPPNAPPQQAYNPYPQQGPPMGQNQPYNYPTTPSTPPQQPNYGGYSPNAPSVTNAPLPPQPNFNSYPNPNGSQVAPGGYQHPHQGIPV
ncbi:hypothetical protein F5I97DRAFT_2007666, partial [Phlebopus sp. FC_14]